MNFRFSRMVHLYYLTALVILGVTACIGVAFYWFSGPANIGNIQSVFEASLQLEELESKKGVAQIKILVDNDKTREAFNKVRKIDQHSKLIDSVIHEGKSFKVFRKSLRNNQEALTALISFPQLSKVMDVLSKKVDSFNKYVSGNRWRTLTRMSKRIRAQLGYKGAPGFFNYSKLTSLVAEISKDIRLMRSITMSSVLSRHSKDMIAARLSSLQTEISMLEKYISSLKKFSVSYQDLKKNYNAWFKEVQPGVSLKRIKFERSSNLFILGLLAFVGAMMAAIGLGFVVYRYSIRHNRKMAEKLILGAVHKGIVPLESELKFVGSKGFQAEFEKCRQYVHKRMAFGNIFRQASPFATLLLDSNLNVVWGNDIFFESWDLMENQKNQRSTISWDYLQRFTNLGGDDPVLTALNNNIAGIYQIQVKTGHDKEAVPYEMYVSPVEYASQKRIMIFFYPLKSLEESIANQTSAIVGPISSTLEALQRGEFNDSFKEKIASDFDVAGINDILTGFIKYDDGIKSQHSGLIREIDNLESEVIDNHKAIADTGKVLEEQKNLQQQIIKHIGCTKKGIVEIVDLRNEMEQLYLNTIVSSKNILKEELELVKMFTGANQMVNENVKVFKVIQSTTKNFKELKNEVEDFKSKIIESLNQALIFQKSSGGSESGISHLLTRMRMEMKGFEKILNEFSSIVRDLDIGINKVGMMMEKNEVVELGPIKEKFVKAKALIETDMFNISRLTRVGQSKDEELVGNLKNLVEVFRSNMQKIGSMEEYLQMNQPSPFGSSEEAPRVEVLN